MEESLGLGYSFADTDEWYEELELWDEVDIADHIREINPTAYAFLGIGEFIDNGCHSYVYDYTKNPDMVVKITNSPIAALTSKRFMSLGKIPHVASVLGVWKITGTPFWAVLQERCFSEDFFPDHIRIPNLDDEKTMSEEVVKEMADLEAKLEDFGFFGDFGFESDLFAPHNLLYDRFGNWQVFDFGFLVYRPGPDDFTLETMPVL